MTDLSKDVQSVLQKLRLRKSFQSSGLPTETSSVSAQVVQKTLEQELNAAGLKTAADSGVNYTAAESTAETLHNAMIAGVDKALQAAGTVKSFTGLTATQPVTSQPEVTSMDAKAVAIIGALKALMPVSTTIITDIEAQMADGKSNLTPAQIAEITPHMDRLKIAVAVINDVLVLF